MNDKIAVLASGGLDSAVMLWHLTRSFQEVHPIYVRCGLYWEEMELRFLKRFLDAVGEGRIRSLQVLVAPMEDIYSHRWYQDGQGIPDYHKSDEQWEIPGRNIILLGKTAVWCKFHSAGAIALGSLESNPFPDASAEFLSLMQQALARGLSHPLTLLQPLAGMHKPDVIRLGQALPLELTLTCARPVDEKHCGSCGKCRERIEGFREAGLCDPTAYRTSG
ncbi:MAG: 7-cyano-7-deazaguanine synthase [Acidobacteriota bacterium]